MPPPAQHLPDGLHWQQCFVTLQAASFARRAHPMSVFEAIVKGAKEAAGIQTPLLWHWPDQQAQSMLYQPGQQIALQLQLFGCSRHEAETLHRVLHQRLTGEIAAQQRHFTLVETSAWQQLDGSHLAHTLPTQATACTLNFYTPLPLPKKGRTDRTAISEAEFLFACRKRIQKLWGVEPALPSTPLTLRPLDWIYWRASHASHSQKGNPLLLNGCIGQLRLEISSLQQWLPWIHLLVHVGMGERLSFSMGRFALHIAPDEPPSKADEHVVRLSNNPPLKSAQDGTGLSEPLRRPLHIERIGCKLSLENENLVIEGGVLPNASIANSQLDTPEKKRYPLRLLQSVHCAQAVGLTSALCHAMEEYGVPLLLGQPGKSPLVYAGGASEHRRYHQIAQHHHAHHSLTADQKTHIAAQWVCAKLNSQMQLVRSRYQAGDNQLLHHLQRGLDALQQCNSVDAVRGWEGISARHYYPWLASQHPDLLAWHGRQRREGDSPDSVNSLLNYAYALLRASIESGLRAHGLDPYLGVLHTPNGRHTALVSDFMEPLRAQADRMVLRLIGLQQIKSEDLQETAMGTTINSKARQTMISRFARQARGPGGVQAQLQALVRSYQAAIAGGYLANWQSAQPAPMDPNLYCDGIG